MTVLWATVRVREL